MLCSILRLNLLLALLLGTTIIAPASANDLSEGDPINVQLSFIQSSASVNRGGLTLAPDGPFRLQRLSELGRGVNRSSVARLGRVTMEPLLQSRIGRESSWVMQGRDRVKAVSSSGETFGEEVAIGPDQNFGVKLSVRVRARSNGQLRVYVHPQVSGLDYENAIEQDGLIFPMMVSIGHVMFADINPGESLLLTGLMSDETRRVLRRTPADSKNPMLERVSAEREKADSDQLLVLITPSIP